MKVLSFRKPEFKTTEFVVDLNVKYWFPYNKQEGKKYLCYVYFYCKPVECMKNCFYATQSRVLQLPDGVKDRHTNDRTLPYHLQAKVIRTYLPHKSG